MKLLLHIQLMHYYRYQDDHIIPAFVIMSIKYLAFLKLLVTSHQLVTIHGIHITYIRRLTLI